MCTVMFLYVVEAYLKQEIIAAYLKQELMEEYAVIQPLNIGKGHKNAAAVLGPGKGESTYHVR